MKRTIAIAVMLWSLLHAGEATIFAASDLKFALDTIKKAFRESHPKDTVRIIYGSSGKGKVQIANGAPYDIYFSANMDYVEALYKSGDIVTKPKLYAIGRLVLWSKHPQFDAKKGFANLSEKWVEKIAIANPSHAPYGEKAKQALIHAGVYDRIASKIVLGENISQTANFIKSGAADIGVIALSLVLAPSIAKSEHAEYFLIDERLHAPLRQGYGKTKYGKDNKVADAFLDFFRTPESQAVMKRFGFSVPRQNAK